MYNNEFGSIVTSFSVSDENNADTILIRKIIMNKLIKKVITPLIALFKIFLIKFIVIYIFC